LDHQLTEAADQDLVDILRETGRRFGRLYYLRGRLDDRRDGVIIARVLHERMEPLRHLTRDLP
jgi:plasmid stabilization system protein ParE